MQNTTDTVVAAEAGLTGRESRLLIGAAPHCHLRVTNCPVPVVGLIHIADEGRVLQVLGDEPWLFVNGDRVRCCPLSEGDELSICGELVDWTQELREIDSDVSPSERLSVVCRDEECALAEDSEPTLAESSSEAAGLPADCDVATTLAPVAETVVIGPVTATTDKDESAADETHAAVAMTSAITKHSVSRVVPVRRPRVEAPRRPGIQLGTVLGAIAMEETDAPSTLPMTRAA